MYLAYEKLSDPLKDFLGKLEAVHESYHVYLGRYNDRGMKDDGKEYPSNIHPIIRTHPETGRKAIYVNRAFTTNIVDINEYESQTILNMIFTHIEDVNFQIRFRWEKNDVAFWDNRCVQHRAIWDYWPQERKGHRVTICGDRPI